MAHHNADADDLSGYVPEYAPRLPKVPDDPYQPVIWRKCGWCGKTLGARPNPDRCYGEDIVTHGLCEPACAEAKAVLGRYAP